MLRELSIWMTGYNLAKGNPGVGPNAWGYWRILIPFQRLFREPTIEHDRLYTIGGGQEEKNEADLKFLDMCYLSAGRNILALFFATLYFILVHYFGNSCFTFNKKTI